MRVVEPSQLYYLVEERLDGTFAELIESRRPHTSWKAIADEVREKTGIRVSSQSLINWFASRIKTTTKVRAA